MNNCFALRFNLQKSGCSVPEDSQLFANMFGVTKEFIDETLLQYEEINTAAANEIKESTKDFDFSYLEGKTMMLTGDSNTSDRLSWGKIIAKILPCNVIDNAVSGARSTNLLPELPRYFQFSKPDIIVIQMGNNDSLFIDKSSKISHVSPEEYRRNLGLIIDSIKSNGVKVIINSLAPSYCEKINSDNPFWSTNEETNELYNNIAKEVAKEKNVPFHDFRSVFNKEEYDELFYTDGTHLSCLAHKRIAESFVNFMGERYENN